MPLRYAIPPAVLLLYYLVVWLLYGRDPKPGPVVPRYTPPPGLTPAAARYVLCNGVDGRSLAALLVDLAWRKRITIEPQGGGKYRVRFVTAPSSQPGSPARASRDGVEEPLPPEEHIAMELLLAWNTPTTADPVTLDMSYMPRNSGLISGILGSLQKQYGGVYYRGNYGLIACAVLGTFLWAEAMALTTPGWRDGIAFLTMWFLFFTLILGMVFTIKVLPAMKEALAGKVGIGHMISIFLFWPILLAVPGLGAYQMVQRSSRDFVLALCFLIVMNVAFGSRMKTLTRKGREMIDYLAGYRQYLVSVESDRMNRMNAPRSPVIVLNEHLPYAIALDVKESWGDHFSDAFFAATASQS